MIKELISKAQNGNKECMQQLICMFDPLLQKYARKLQKEDASEDLVLSFIELVISIKLNNFAGCGDGTFVSYIQVSVGNCYKKILEKIIKDKSVICISDLSDEQRFYFDVKLSKNDNYNILDELGASKILNKWEYEVVYMIYICGYSAASIARITNRTRQSVNQTKNRALKKLKDSFDRKR